LHTKILSNKNHLKKFTSKKAKQAAQKPLTVKGKLWIKIYQISIWTLILEQIGNPQQSSKIKLSSRVPSSIDWNRNFSQFPVRARKMNYVIPKYQSRRIWKSRFWMDSVNKHLRTQNRLIRTTNQLDQVTPSKLKC
jgi:hypothetical protein